MIRVTVYKTGRHGYTGIDLSGHAGYEDAGHDIVCAAVSVLVINTVNSIERFTEDKTSCISDEDTGSIQFRFINPPTHDASLLFESMVSGLEAIEENSEYEPYIDIIFKEV
ncbi:MAG: ribosomal-processing cysteine protease Prp [Mediterraneibacter sp.]